MINEKLTIVVSELNKEIHSSEYDYETCKYSYMKEASVIALLNYVLNLEDRVDKLEKDLFEINRIRKEKYEKE